MADAQVFVIHPEKDNDVLQKLISEYNDRTFGNTIVKIKYVDSSQPLLPGHDFGETIKTYINNAACVLAIITPNSLKSTWVNQEIGFTLGKEKPLLTVKKYTMSSKGCGFLHSSIDSQLYKKDQRGFPKIDKFFENEYGKTANKVLGSLTIKPTKETGKVASRRVK